MKNNLSNFKYSIISQAIVILFGIIRALLIPILLSVTEFGYWQIYLLYAGFVGIFTFGFNDGIYLRYGSKHQHELPWGKLRGAFSFYLLLLFTISLILILVLELLSSNSNKVTAFIYVIVNVGLMGASSLFLFLFQTTNQIKKYSIYLLVDKLVFIILLFLAFSYSNVNYELLMIIDCFSKFILVVAMTLNCRRDLFGVVAGFRASYQEFNKNICVGIKLMLANLASMLVMNMSRFFVEKFYTLEEFSTFSFGISLTNIFLMAMNGVAVALYPFLKRISEENYNKVYSELSDATALFLFVALFAYYPIYYLIWVKLTDYAEVLTYFNVLYVVALLQIKMNVVINTFYKVLRKEKALLKANVVCVAIGFSLSSLVVFFDETLELMALALAATIIFRVYRSDFFICNILKDYKFEKFILELAVFGSFILATKYLPIACSFSLLVLFTIVYFYIHKNKLEEWLCIFKGSK